MESVAVAHDCDNCITLWGWGILVGILLGILALFLETKDTTYFLCPFHPIQVP